LGYKLSAFPTGGSSHVGADLPLLQAAIRAPPPPITKVLIARTLSKRIHIVLSDTIIGGSSLKVAFNNPDGS
jgi:hypothetical protein